jgi:hypothetical protein
MRNGFSPWIRALGRIVWWKKIEGQKFCGTVPLIFTFLVTISTVYDVYLFICCYPLKCMRANNRFCKNSQVVIRFPRSHWDRRIRFCSLIETAGSDPAGSLKLWDPIPRSYWNHRIKSYGLMTMLNLLPRSHWDIGIFYTNVHNGNRSRGLLETAGINPAVSLKPQELILWSHWNRRKQSRVPIETAESELCKRLSWISRRIQPVCETALAQESGS